MTLEETGNLDINFMRSIISQLDNHLLSFIDKEEKKTEQIKQSLELHKTICSIQHRKMETLTEKLG